MTALLIIVAIINLGLLCALMVKYQPQTGLPQKPPSILDQLMGQPVTMVNPYAQVFQQQQTAQPPVYAPQMQAQSAPVYMAPQVQQQAQPEDLTPLYQEAARQLDMRLERMEKLLAKAEQAQQQLEASMDRVVQEQPAGLPTRHGKVKFLNNQAVQSILQLAEQGKSPMVIARELGRGVDEVMLTLNLRQMAG